MEPTSDPGVWIEERYEGYVRYRNSEGRRWEVHGICDRRGDCLIGSSYQGHHIATHDDIEELKRRYGVERLGPELDVPILPEMAQEEDHCCAGSALLFVEL